MLVLAPEEPGPADEEVARTYPEWPEKGEPVGGRQITLLTSRHRVRCGEEVRVIHVAEALDPSARLYFLAAKPVLGEIVDGVPAGPAAPTSDDPLRPGPLYDGPVLAGPAIDPGWLVTRYRFDRPGDHEIVWKLGDLVSNRLRIRVTLKD